MHRPGVASRALLLPGKGLEGNLRGSERRGISPSAGFLHLAGASGEGRTPAPTLGLAFSELPGVFTSR